jgi:phosphatidylserine decarboxylase
MKFAPYGIREIVTQFTLAAVVAAFFVAASFLLAAKVLLLFILLPLAWVLFVFYFFRDPQRSVPAGDDSIVSPADGTIVEITEQEEPEFIGSLTRKTGIFLSLFSVHVNRSPCGAKVAYLKYTPGRFLSAASPKSSRQNESNSIGLVTQRGKILLRQIAGVIARRIICEIKEGDSLEKGEKFGMIKFGSRTEIYLPVQSGFECRVSVGQKVKAGETVLGVFK